MKISSNIDIVIAVKFRTGDPAVASSWVYLPKYAQYCDSVELSTVDKLPCLLQWLMPSILVFPYPRDQLYTQPTL